MQRKTRFNWKLLALGLVVAVIAAFTACSSPTGGGDGGGTVNHTVRFWHAEEEYRDYVTSVPDGSKISAPSLVPMVDEQEFIAWYKEEAFTNEWYFDKDTVTKPTNLHARFNAEDDKVTVTFDANDDGYTGDVPKKQEIVRYMKAEEPTPPTYQDHDFGGWFEEKAATTLWDFSTRVIDNITLYAKWTKHTFYKVTFWNGESEHSSIANAREGFKINAPDPEPTKSGESFIGWYRDETNPVNEWIFETDTVTESINLYAHFNPNGDTVTVTFTLYDDDDPANEAKYSGSDSLTQTITKHTKVKKLAPDPTRDMYGLLGWYVMTAKTPLDTDKEWNFSDRVTSNLTLYTKWISPYKVTFAPNGGTFQDPNKGDPQLVKHGEKAESPGTIQREGYSFDGWWTGSGSNWGRKWTFETDLVVNTMTLTAKWEKIHVVRFNPNGGTFENSGLTTERTQAVKNGDFAPELTVTLNEFSFIAWYTKNGTASGDWGARWEFKNPVMQDMTLTARWVPMHRVIFLDLSEDNPQEVRRVIDNTKIAPPANFERDGRKPVGWYMDPAYRNQWNFNSAVKSSFPLYAKWPSPYTVTFITGKIGTDAIKEVKVWEGDTINKEHEADVPKAGAESKFLYWVDEANPAVKWDLATKQVTRNTRLRPQWDQFNVGEKGPGDGFIIHAPEGGFTLFLDANDTVGVQANYLELAPSNVSTKLSWYTEGNVAGARVDDVAVKNPTTNQQIGRGRQNTSIILNTVTDRAKAEAALKAFEFDDSGTWFLPNIEEFKLLANQKEGFFELANTTADIYWLSNQNLGQYGAFGGAFNSSGTMNSEGAIDKSKQHFVRPVRAW